MEGPLIIAGKKEKNFFIESNDILVKVVPSSRVSMCCHGYNRSLSQQELVGGMGAKQQGNGQ